MRENRLIACIAASLLFLVGAIPAYAIDQAEFNKMMDGYLASEDNLEKVGSALEKYFAKRRDEQRKQQAQDEAKKMEEQFENPVDVSIDNAPIKGNPDAPITVVEFSDFECPFCKRGKETMDQLVKAYPEKVRVAFKHLPLPFHKNAKPASRAALAAGEQGKFWEMHGELFNNQNKLNQEGFIEMAKNIGLDVEKFKADMENKAAEFDKIIEADMKEANQLGVRGTPGFFVNGVQVRGARPLPYFKNLVDKWIEKQNS